MSDKSHEESQTAALESIKANVQILVVIVSLVGITVILKAWFG